MLNLNNKPITLKKEKIYNYLQYDLDPTQIKDDINIKVSYEHDKVVYHKYRKSQILISIFDRIIKISLNLSILATPVTALALICYSIYYTIEWLKWLCVITFSVSIITIIVSFVILCVVLVAEVITECLSYKFFKPYTGGNQFIGVTEDIIDKKFSLNYKSLEDLCDIDTYRDYMINLSMAEFLADNDICSFDLINDTSQKYLPFNKIKFYGYGLSKQVVTKTFDLKTLVVDDKYPMRLYYDFDEQIICLQIPQTYITEYKAKDLHIELSRLRSFYRQCSE